MKLAKFLLANLMAFASLLLIALLVGFWLRNPNLVNKKLPLALPKTITRGDIGQPLQSGHLVLKFVSTGRISARALPSDIRLSSRAQLGYTDDYLWIELSLSNTGQDILLDYQGVGQTVKFLLGVRKPQPQVVSALLSRDIQTIGRTSVPLPSGILAQEESWQGVIAFPLSHGMSELSLLLIPSVQDSSLPAFEVKLDE